MSTSPSPDILQAFGALSDVRIGLSTEVRSQSVRALNRLLAHTMAIRDTFKKAHWQTSGPAFHQLLLPFDQHYNDQVLIMDALAERVQTLGGVTFALAQDVVDESSIARAPRGRESAIAQLSRLLDAHETILLDAREIDFPEVALPLAA